MPGGKAANFLQANLARGRGVKMVWLARRRDRSGEKGWADEVDWRTNEGGAPVGSEGDGAEDLAAGPALRSGHGAAGGRRERRRGEPQPLLRLSLSLSYGLWWKGFRRSGWGLIFENAEGRAEVEGEEAAEPGAQE